MKFLVKARWVLLYGLIILFPLSGGAQDKGKGSSDTNETGVQVQKSLEGERDSQENAEQKASTEPVRMPIYKPPLRGAPAGRVAGGTRGAGGEIPYLCLLVPEHVGLTVREQPCLHYFLSQPTSYPMEFTIIERKGIYPLVETPIRSPNHPGIHAICLSDYDVRLKKGIQYRWFVALVPNAQHRSKDVLAAGAIELVDLPNGLRTQLQGAGKASVPYIYAEAGIWYDALSDLSTLVKNNPQGGAFRRQRASLLEQVGLVRVAEYEKQLKRE